MYPDPNPIDGRKAKRGMPRGFRRPQHFHFMTPAPPPDPKAPSPWRLLGKMPIKELARRIGRSQLYTTRVLYGRTPAMIETAVRMALVLQVDVGRMVKALYRAQEVARAQGRTQAILARYKSARYRGQALGGGTTTTNGR